MMKRLLAIVAILFVVTLVSICVTGWLLAKPMQMRVGDPPSDLHAQSISFASDSGATVRGWWCPTANSREVVLLLPGIRANRLSMVDRALFLRRAGYTILLIDFQATGETKGDHITFGWKESRDVIAAVDFIYHVEPSNRIVVVGSSLGGAAALLATPPLKVDGLVLEAVYPTIEIATRNRMENYLGPVGRPLTLLLLKQLPSRLGISSTQLRPIDHIADVHCPILIVSGEKDRNTRRADTQMLFDRANPPKQLWFVPNAGHVDLHQAGSHEYEARILAFCAKSLEQQQ